MVWKPGIDEDFRQDWFDRRDAIYAPSLRPLNGGQSTISLLYGDSGSQPGTGCTRQSAVQYHPRILVRDQKADATCSGNALAGVIDIMRFVANPNAELRPVSARMLYEMACDVEGITGASGGGVQTLRAVVKGFWHNGVCLESEWPSDGDQTGNILTVERAKSARAITLGAYFRIRTILLDFHCAISEAGAILVSAKVHSGWSREEVRRNNGRIVVPSGGDAQSPDAHAFIVVGWDRDGFLVLNSSGPDWGHFQNLPGIAHWSYRDWSERVLDAWVLQLGATTPEAFDLCHCPQGLFGGLLSTEETRSATIATTTPRSHLVGHYAHLDDARHVSTGPFPSSPDDVMRPAH